MIHCGFIGLGLIGGSIAKALKQNREDIKITIYDPDAKTCSLALSQKIADIVATSIDESFRDCDFIFLCAPVADNDENLRNVLSYKKNGCILTDVGSVKAPINRQMEKLNLQDCFIGGHPMAGSERIGFANAKASLLENAYYIIAPAPLTPPDSISLFRELVLSTGAIPLLIDCNKHDYITAAVSHLPHIVASSLVNFIRDNDSEDGLMKSIAAGGFKDITRIASASPVMWQQICLTNRENILDLLDRYINSLTQIRHKLETGDPQALYNFFNDARHYRDSFIEANSGPIKKTYFLRVDIPDQAGSLAAVASLLAQNRISIKNIGIAHNREVEEGVLRIEFYEEDTRKRAFLLLTEQGYTTHPD